MKRRTLLKASLVSGGIVGLLKPHTVIAAYPAEAFINKEVAAALSLIHGDATSAASDAIRIETPHVASDLDMVPIRVSSSLEKTESISIVVEGNKFPFTAFFKFHQAQSQVSTRIKVEQSTDVLVVVKAGGSLHTNKRSLRVSNGICRT